MQKPHTRTSHIFVYMHIYVTRHMQALTPVLHIYRLCRDGPGFAHMGGYNVMSDLFF